MGKAQPGLRGGCWSERTSTIRASSAAVRTQLGLQPETASGKSQGLETLRRDPLCWEASGARPWGPASAEGDVDPEGGRCSWTLEGEGYHLSEFRSGSPGEAELLKSVQRKRLEV